MQIKQTYTFKGIKEKKAGSFTNKEGKLINYNDTYKILVDEIYEGVAYTREFKLKKEMALALSPLLKLYDNIVITFDIVLLNDNEFYLKIINIVKQNKL